MPNTFTLIASSTVGAGGASSIDFTSIPSTYTDLCLKMSVRVNTAGGPNGLFISFNGSTANFTGKYLQGSGSAATSASLARYIGTEDSNAFTANVFNNLEVYIPNYASSNNKSFSADAVSENNGTTAYATFNAGLWSITTAINQITVTGSDPFLQYSTAYLYGVTNA